MEDILTQKRKKFIELFGDDRVVESKDGSLTIYVRFLTDGSNKFEVENPKYIETPKYIVKLKNDGEIIGEFGFTDNNCVIDNLDIIGFENLLLYMDLILVDIIGKPCQWILRYPLEIISLIYSRIKYFDTEQELDDFLGYGMYFNDIFTLLTIVYNNIDWYSELHFFLNILLKINNKQKFLTSILHISRQDNGLSTLKTYYITLDMLGESMVVMPPNGIGNLRNELNKLQDRYLKENDIDYDINLTNKILFLRKELK